ncbi:MAG: redoxin domain-containing protein [Proteobacteria bacterium]|nr:redoxin domain-containing protein [Pseudomonadota bacterium]
MASKKIIILGGLVVVAGGALFALDHFKKAEDVADDGLTYVDNPSEYVDDRMQKPLDIDESVAFVPIEVPDFTLQDFNGNTFTKENLKGKYSLIYFGFVNCPDVCINSTDGLNQAYEALTPEEQAKVQVYYFSFDTGRDTPERIKDYLSAFNDKFIGVSGYGDYKQQMGMLMHSFDIIADKKLVNGNYAFSHSNHSYLLDPNANFLTQYNYQTVTEHPEKIVEDLRHIWAKQL